MFWDIALAAALGLIQLGLAYLGWRVSAPEHKMLGYFFLGVGLLGVSLTIALAYRAASSQGELQRQLERVLFKINDVSVSFRIKVPLEHPALKDYRLRVEKCAQQMKETLQLQCGAGPHSFDIAGRTYLKDFSIPTNSELYPRQQTEEIPYLLLTQPAIKVGMFVAQPTYQEGVGIQSKPDLSFMAGKLMHAPDNNPPGRASFVLLYYDIETKTLFIEGTRVPTIEGNWHSNGQIASIPDLTNAWVSLFPIISTPKLANVLGGDTVEWQTTREIDKTCSLEEVTLYVSNGWEFPIGKDQLNRIVRNNYGEQFYLVKLGRG